MFSSLSIWYCGWGSWQGTMRACYMLVPEARDHSLAICINRATQHIDLTMILWKTMLIVLDSKLAQCLSI